MSKSSENVSSTKTVVETLKGDIFALLSAVAGAAASLLIKTFREEKVFVVLLRGLFQFLILFPIASYKKVDLLGPNWKFLILLIARGFAGTISTVTLAMSLRFLPLGDATAILYTYPVIVMFFACICLEGKSSFIIIGKKCITLKR